MDLGVEVHVSSQDGPVGLGGLHTLQGEPWRIDVERSVATSDAVDHLDPDLGAAAAEVCLVEKTARGPVAQVDRRHHPGVLTATALSHDVATAHEVVEALLELGPDERQRSSRVPLTYHQLVVRVGIDHLFVEEILDALLQCGPALRQLYHLLPD